MMVYIVKLFLPFNVEAIAKWLDLVGISVNLTKTHCVQLELVLFWWG